MNPGTQIASRYTLLRELGRGGMGAVYIARDDRLGGEVALKVAFVGADAPELRERFQREARIGNRLGKTTGFVRAFDFGEVSGTGQLYLAMDLVPDAKPLDLTTGPLPARIARLRDAARLVAEAHRQGVIHRDLKPANFLQEPSGRLWLSDFGLSKVQDDQVPELVERAGLTRSGTAAGTPAFMPPEQFEDVKRVDARCDVYALGVMLYAAVTLGRVPYEGSITAIAQRHARVGAGLEPAPAPSRVAVDVPLALDRVCVQALELEREKRLASADLFVTALAAYLAEAPAPPAPESIRVARPTAATIPITPPPFTPRPPAPESGSDRPPIRRVLVPVAPAPRTPPAQPRPPSVPQVTPVAPPSNQPAAPEPTPPPKAPAREAKPIAHAKAPAAHAKAPAAHAKAPAAHAKAPAAHAKAPHAHAKAPVPGVPVPSVPASPPPGRSRCCCLVAVIVLGLITALGVVIGVASQNPKHFRKLFRGRPAAGLIPSFRVAMKKIPGEPGERFDRLEKLRSAVEDRAEDVLAGESVTLEGETAVLSLPENVPHDLLDELDKDLRPQGLVIFILSGVDKTPAFEGALLLSTEMTSYETVFANGRRVVRVRYGPEVANRVARATSVRVGAIVVAFADDVRVGSATVQNAVIGNGFEIGATPELEEALRLHETPYPAPVTVQRLVK